MKIMEDFKVNRKKDTHEKLEGETGLKYTFDTLVDGESHPSFFGTRKKTTSFPPQVCLCVTRRKKIKGM